MVVRIHPWRITWRFLLVYLIVFAIAFASCFSIFFSIDEYGTVHFNPFGGSQIVFLIIAGGLFVFTYILALIGQSYVIEDKYFTVRRLKKELVFEYKNIIFVDINESKRKKMVILYTQKGGMKYLLGDRDGKLLETIIKKCPNTMSVEEFRRSYPRVRY